MSKNNKNKSTSKTWGYNSDSYKFGGNNNNIYFHGLRKKNMVIGSNSIKTLFTDLISVMVVTPTLGTIVAT
jgi:hypothetical protein